jgi:hypothetical protein
MKFPGSPFCWYLFPPEKRNYLKPYNRLGSQVDKRIELNKLYSVLAMDKHTRGTKSQPAMFNTIGLGTDGGYAEYVIVKADNLVEVVRHCILSEMFKPYTYSSARGRLR